MTRVIVGGHPVAMLGNHACVIILADPCGEYKDDARFSQTIKLDGRTWICAVLSSSERNVGISGGLVAWVNRAGEIEKLRTKRELAASEADVKALLACDEYFRVNYNGKLRYWVFPAKHSNSFNSNSYVFSLLTHAGLIPPNFSNFVIGGFAGWERLIPADMFGV